MLKRVEMRTDRFTIAKMTLADWPDVQSIYAQGIDGGQATFQTKVPEWKEWDASHHRFGRLVARRKAKVVGWVALAPVSTRACYRGVAELSVYVSSSDQRRVEQSRCSLLLRCACHPDLSPRTPYSPRFFPC